MVGTEKVGKFVHNNVFDALTGPVDQIKIEVQRALLEITASPSRFHGVDADGSGQGDETALLVGQTERRHTRQDEVLVAIVNDGQQAFLFARLLRGGQFCFGSEAPCLCSRDGNGDLVPAPCEKGVNLSLRGRSRDGQADRPVRANAQIQPFDTSRVEFIRIFCSRIDKGLLSTVLFAIHFLASTPRSRQSNSYSAVLLESQ